MVRVDLRDSGAPGISALVAGAGLATTIGIAEFARAGIEANASSLELQRGLLLVVAVYAALGALSGLACWAARRISAAPAAALAVLLVVAAGGAESRPILRVAALALGFVVLRLGALVLTRFSGLPRARLAASAALLSIAALCALAARALPAYGPRWALGAAVAAGGGAILVWTPRVRGSALLLAGAALFLVWQGAQHVQRLAPSVKPAAAAPSVLLVTIDTLRADRVGAYGYGAARTPNLDALAKRGILFRTAISHSFFTGPSHASILTGLLPTTHGFFVNGQRLDAKFSTLAESFAAAGYVTAAFPSAWVTQDAASALPRHFQYSDQDLREHREWPLAIWRCVALRPLRTLLEGANTWPPYRPAAATVDRAARWLETQAGSPVFTWVHLFDPHLPYAPPADLRPASADRVSGEWYGLDAAARREIVVDPDKTAAMHDLYDAEITYADRELGRLVTAARAAAPGGRLLLVITADHGEPMGEHGHFWQRDLYDETLRVPLVIVPPEPSQGFAKEVAAQVRLVDIAPTLLAWLGLPPLAHSDGVSLLPLARAETLVSPGPAIASFHPGSGDFQPVATAVRTDAFKWIASEAGWRSPDRWFDASERLFDLVLDPRETTDTTAAHPDVVAELRAQAPQAPLAPERALSEEERAQLRALGYVE